MDVLVNSKKVLPGRYAARNFRVLISELFACLHSTTLMARHHYFVALALPHNIRTHFHPFQKSFSFSKITQTEERNGIQQYTQQKQQEEL